MMMAISMMSVKATHSMLRSFFICWNAAVLNRTSSICMFRSRTRSFAKSHTLDW
jgi:hypothetical protein